MPNETTNSSSNSNVNSNSNELHPVLINKLKKYYQSQNKITRIFGEQFSVTESYINLSIVEEANDKKEGVKKEGEENKKDENSNEENEREELLHADDIVYGTKKSIELKQLFIDENANANKPLKKQVIFGRAGIGKTTMCSYIAVEWANDKLWNDKFDYVLWIPLRQLAQEFKKLGEKNKKVTLKKVIQTCCCEKNSNEITTSAKELKKFFQEEAHKNKTLLLLDGYDEVASFAMDENDPLAIFLAQLFSNFPYLLLTSRPCPINVKNNTVTFDRQLENIGLTDQNITAFTATIVAKEKASLFIAFLKNNPNLWSLAHVPINLELIAEVWKREIFISSGNSNNNNLENNLNLNSDENSNVNNANNNMQTMTYLYERITHYLFYRFLGDRKKIQKKDLNNTTIFVAKTQAIKTVLEKLAFYGMQNKTIIIPGNKCKEIIEQVKLSYSQEITLNEDVLNCGLLRSIGTSFLIEGNDYYFIHLTFQEFFAASEMQQYFYQSLLSSSAKHLKLFREHKYDEYYEIMWAFTAGLLYQYYQAKKENLLQNSELPLLRFWDAFLSEPRDVIGLRETVLTIRCLEECAADTSIAIHKKLLANVAKWFGYLVEKEFIFEKTELVIVENQSFRYFMRYLSITPVVRSSQIFNAAYDNKNRVGNVLKKLFVLLKEVKLVDNDSIYLAFKALSEFAKVDPKFPEIVIAKIINLLENSIYRVRERAIRVLYEFSKVGANLPETAIAKVIKLLKEDCDSVRCEIANTLAEFVKKSIKFPDPEATIEKAIILCSKEKNVNALVKFAKAGIQLPETITTLAMEKLSHNFHDNELDAICSILVELAKTWEKSIEMVIAKAVESCVLENKVLYKLAQRGIVISETSIATLIILLKDNSHFVKEKAANTLAGLAQAGIKILTVPKAVVISEMKLLENGDTLDKANAVMVLGNLAQAGAKIPKKIITLSIELLKDKQWECRHYVISALDQFAQAKIKISKANILAIIKLIKSDYYEVQDWDVKGVAICVLGNFVRAGIKLPEAAVEAVTEALKNSCTSTRKYIVETLVEFAKSRIKFSGETIETMMELCKNSYNYEELSRESISALGEFAKARIEISKKAIMVAIGMLNDFNDKRVYSVTRGCIVSVLKELAIAKIQLPEIAVTAVVDSLCMMFPFKADVATDTLEEFAKEGLKLLDDDIKKLIVLLECKWRTYYSWTSAKKFLDKLLILILHQLFSECANKDSNLLTTELLKNIAQFSLYHPLLLSFNSTTKKLCFQLERKRYEISVPAFEWENTQKKILEIFYQQAKDNQLPLDYYENQFKFGFGADSTSLIFSNPSKTQLHLLAEQGKVEEIKNLLEQNIIDINDQNNAEQLTPIMGAINNKQEQVIKLLLDKGADLNRTEKLGRTALNLLLQFIPDNNDLLLKFIRQRTRFAEAYLRQCLEKCLYADRKTLDTLISSLLGSDIGKTIKTWHAVYYAHAQSFKGNIQQESSSNAQQLEGMNFSDFLSIRIRLYIELWINIKKGAYADLPEVNLVVTEQLLRELLVNLDTLFVAQINDIIFCKKNMSEDVTQAIAAQAENIFDAIKQLKIGEEYTVRSGYDSAPFGHCLYVSVQRVADNLIIRVDNRGDGYDRHLPVCNNILNNAPTTKLKPYLVGVVALGELKNSTMQQKIIGYLKGIIAAPLGDSKGQAFKKIYQKINQTSLPNSINWPDKKIQIIGNCTMRSHNVGVEIRINNSALYKWMRKKEAGLISEIGKTLKKNNSSTTTNSANSTLGTGQSGLLGSGDSGNLNLNLLLTSSSTFFQKAPTHENLMKHFQQKLGVDWKEVYTGSVVEENLVKMAGIKNSNQSNALYRRQKNSEAGDTYFELDLTSSQSRQFLKYYQSNYPSLIISWKYNEENQRLWVLMNTVVLFNEVAPALGSYKNNISLKINLNLN